MKESVQKPKFTYTLYAAITDHNWLRMEINCILDEHCIGHFLPWKNPAEFVNRIHNRNRTEIHVAEILFHSHHNF